MLEESESLKKQTFLGLSKEEFGPMALLPSGCHYCYFSPRGSLAIVDGDGEPPQAQWK
jgi:hypothetical protein